MSTRADVNAKQIAESNKEINNQTENQKNADESFFYTNPLIIYVIQVTQIGTAIKPTVITIT